jgi:hypothetical protein
LSSENLVLLGAAVFPVILAIAVYYYGWKLGKRHDEQEQQKLDQGG